MKQPKPLRSWTVRKQFLLLPPELFASPNPPKKRLEFPIRRQFGINLLLQLKMFANRSEDEDATAQPQNNAYEDGLGMHQSIPWA
jgi:hypothetical protein